MTFKEIQSIDATPVFSAAALFTLCNSQHSAKVSSAAVGKLVSTAEKKVDEMVVLEENTNVSGMDMFWGFEGLINFCFQSALTCWRVVPETHQICLTA